MENKLEELGRRIKFKLTWAGKWSCTSKQSHELTQALKNLKNCGYAQKMSDGAFTGNLALRVEDQLIISRSRRMGGALELEDFVKVLFFDNKKWEAQYMSIREEIEPSSDTPLYWKSLIEIPVKFGWKKAPVAAIHGHAFESELDAIRLGVPISDKLTEFCTPKDSAALEELLKKYPYPYHKVFIRKGHGFFILGSSISELNSIALGLLKK